MWDYYNQAMHHVNTWTRTEWSLVFAVVVIWGVFCMRGYGSRSNY